MFIHLMRHKKGMSTIEYAVLVATVVAALVVMQIPLRRAISSRWRSAADAFGNGRQYENQGGHATSVMVY